MDKYSLINSLRPAIQTILDRTFSSDYSKRRIKVKYSTINFACPHCLDSVSDSTRKRGNLIVAGPCAGFYKCFNCGCFQSAVDFFKSYHIELDRETLKYLNDLRDNFNSNRRSTKTDFSALINGSSNQVQKKLDLSLVDLVYDQEEIDKYTVTKEDLRNSKKPLLDVTESNVALDYLKSRNQLYEQNFHKFGYDKEKNALVIYNVTRDGRILGFQERLLDQNVKNKYLTIKTHRIFSDFFNIEKKIPEKIDKLSTMFNIFTVNFNQPIICLEGPLDSFLIPNSIATSSASIDPPDILEGYYYMYDSDPTGVKYSLNKIKNNEYVFLWDKLKSDLELPKKAKWDWNMVHTYLKEHNMNPVEDLLPYFSNNPLDQILI